MTAREQLIAYLATLGTLALVIIAALIVAALAPGVMGKMEVFGLGTVTGGLIGVLRIPTARTPVASTDSGDVNVSQETK
ncbi:MAG: hypothetical protein JWN66_3079 [Sphingomonas bacterium]|uniref:hypothetical protein n=1 Tax=Sphingomonas bacterium TaxID=1895847 RepID=UPI002615BC5C|nr:hypothetical protein [Sphingomonas bacterium]MDB5705963.1 hypothetical protein [Sphingomonas bacterium]